MPNRHHQLLTAHCSSSSLGIQSVGFITTLLSTLTCQRVLVCRHHRTRAYGHRLLFICPILSHITLNQTITVVLNTSTAANLHTSCYYQQHAHGHSSHHPFYLQNHQNHGTIVPPIRIQTMASMLVIPLFQPGDHLSDASSCIDPVAFR